jgi:hypothetical protein
MQCIGAARAIWCGSFLMPANCTSTLLCAAEPVIGKHLSASKDASNTTGQVWWRPWERPEKLPSKWSSLELLTTVMEGRGSGCQSGAVVRSMFQTHTSCDREGDSLWQRRFPPGAPVSSYMHYKSPNIVYRAINNVLVEAQLSTQYFKGRGSERLSQRHYFLIMAIPSLNTPSRLARRTRTAMNADEINI